MSTAQQASHVIVDVETSGLDPTYCEILEIAAMAMRVDTQGRFQPVSESFQRVVRPAYLRMDTTDAGTLLGPVNSEREALEMHHKSGLLAELQNGIAVSAAAADFEAWLGDVAAGAKPIMVGCRPSFDRGFLREHMPRVEARLSWKSLDVSSLRLLVATVMGMAPDRLREAVHTLAAHVTDAEDQHRAVGGVLDCYAELCAAGLAVQEGQAALRTLLQKTGAIA